MILLPSHRDRANNSMYYNMAENGQVDTTSNDFYCRTCHLKKTQQFVTVLFFFLRTTTCSVPYFSKLALVSRVLILTWIYQRKVMHRPLQGKCTLTCCVSKVSQRVCWCVYVPPNPLPPHSLFQRSQQLESGWREQGAGILHASLYWRGNDAPCPSKVLPTRYFLRHSCDILCIKSLVGHTKVWYFLNIIIWIWLLCAGNFLIHCDAFHHQNSEPPPALPVRSLRKVQTSIRYTANQSYDRILASC